MTIISDNFCKVQERIAAVCARAGRNPESVTLVVVTKMQPVEKVLQVLEAGATNLGENFPEETDSKIREMGEIARVNWHMIGHIQSRKIKFIVKHFSFVHSIDRVEIAEKLSSACVAASTRIPVLIEVNIAREESKFGFVPGNPGKGIELVDQICRLATLPGIEMRGIMCMPPLAKKPEDSRGYFHSCRELLLSLRSQSGLNHFDQLSMGTSSDFEVAIEEGSNYLRIGEAIMGPRIYQ